MIDLPELIVLDVGHGNCAILRDTKTVTVIDCPSLPRTLLEALEILDIHTVDQVLISHADLDHAGGLVSLLDVVTVRNVYINPDADKKSKSWNTLCLALDLAVEKGTEVHVGLTSSLSGRIISGRVEIEILAPSIEIALHGAGGEDSEARRLSSNSMSVVIGLLHDSHRVALLPGDLDDVGLDNLLKKRKNIEAQILVFPHHGGSPGNSNGLEFAQRLCELVKPRLVIFSFDRDQFDNPKEDVIRGVLSTVPEAHIICTQLSRKCAIELPNAYFDHLTSLPAKGRMGGKCCGGTISIKIDGNQTTYAPLLTLHRDFVSNKIHVSEPMCLQHLIKMKSEV